MQTWSGPNTSGVSAPTRKLLTIIVSIFSLVGLVVGFAVGGLTHPRDNTANTPNPTPKTTTPVEVTTTATATATQPPDIILGFPKLVSYSLTESLTGGPYSAQIQAMDKKNPSKPIHASDITCKLWLVPQIPANQVLSIDSQTLKNVDGLSSPIQGTISGQPLPVTEIQKALNFDPTTNQTTTCDANGQFTWKYTISPIVLPGTYDLVILTDWKGKHYNWSWADITVK